MALNGDNEDPKIDVEFKDVSPIEGLVTLPPNRGNHGSGCKPTCGATSP